jgi:hypothetical protein
MLVSSFAGLAAALVVYCGFIAYEFVKAGRAGLAIGVGVFPRIATQPKFLLSAGIAFALAFYQIARR